MDVINLDQKFAQFSEHWRPKIAARLNGQDVKLVKVQGVFPWHTHADCEEMFLVWKGQFRVEFRDRVATAVRCSTPRGTTMNSHSGRCGGRGADLRTRRSAQHR